MKREILIDLLQFLRSEDQAETHYDNSYAPPVLDMYCGICGAWVEQCSPGSVPLARDALCVDCDDIMDQVKKELKITSCSTADLEHMLYRFARLLRNTDGWHPERWGLRSMDLLAELRQIDPEKYDELVKQ